MFDGETLDPGPKARIPSSSPQRAKVVTLYTNPPPNSTVVCLDELGPVSLRTFPPAPSWSPDAHRIKAPLEYSRGPKKVWVYGPLRVRDGKALTLIAPSRNTKGYLRLLEAVAQANPTGDLYLITHNLSSHKSPPIREWLENDPRVEQVFIPVGRRAGSTCKRRGGDCFGARPWQDRASPTPRRSSWPRG